MPLQRLSADPTLPRKQSSSSASTITRESSDGVGYRDSLTQPLEHAVHDELTCFCAAASGSDVAVARARYRAKLCKRSIYRGLA